MSQRLILFSELLAVLYRWIILAVFSQLLTTPHVAFAHARLSRLVGYIGPYKEPLVECQRHSLGGYCANCRARINNLSVARCLLYPSVSLVVHA